ncbi:integrase [Gammaproteobacteria bacterium 50_400_T64]|nr:integrase [Gammaproteobacteria bacterium 50_400_T64]
MGTVNQRGGKLFIDFRYQGIRCREYTKLDEEPKNRIRLKKLIERIEAEILLGNFDYANYFPNSKRVNVFDSIDRRKTKSLACTPSFADFTETWFAEMSAEWRSSYTKSTRLTLNKYLLPTFGAESINTIKKADVLAFRAKLVSMRGESRTKQMSASRINHIMMPLRMILNEASDRFEFVTPWQNIKPLKVPRTEVEPFDLDEVNTIIEQVRSDFRSYYTVRFFTGLRTAEIDGLMWSKIDFKRRQILIHQTWVEGEFVPTKNDGSYRAVDMSSMVYEALRDQHQMTKDKPYVFCNSVGRPLTHQTVTNKVWHPLLRHLGLSKRRPYQTRHTAATLWLAAGESPEWIAKQMGHSNTEMLFKVYSRYVPNLTRQDGSAMERMLEQHSEQKSKNKE